MKIFVFLLFFSKIFSQTINPRDFCYKPSECENGSGECITFKCHGKINYECKGFCSTEKFSCQSINLWSTVLRTGEKFNKFVSAIAICPYNEWKAEDVCLDKRKTCSQGLSSEKCECTGKFSFACGNAHCAIDKHGCNQLKKAKASIKKLKINECNIESNTFKDSFLNRLIRVFTHQPGYKI